MEENPLNSVNSDVISMTTPSAHHKDFTSDFIILTIL
jgi:hypothetical protein